MKGVTLRPARTGSVTIERDPRAVHAYVADPRNLPHWAPGFARSVRQEGLQTLTRRLEDRRQANRGAKV